MKETCRCSLAGESRLPGVGYTGESLLPSVGYTGKSRLPGIACTVESLVQLSRHANGLIGAIHHKEDCEC
jgi:hypothetical protein